MKKDSNSNNLLNERTNQETNQEIKPETNQETNKNITDVLEQKPLPLDTYNFGHSSLQVSPERGASLPSLILDGVEIFYNDPLRRNNPNMKLREGFWMGPQAGGFSEEQQKKYGYNLKKHGFLRDFPWNNKSTDQNIIYEFSTNPSTKDTFPYDFITTQHIILGNKKADINLHIQNISSQDLLFAPGHHTFYKVSPEQKKNIILDDNMQVSEKMKNERLSGKSAIKIINPGSSKVFIPGIGTLGLTFDPTFKYLRLWTEKDKGFVCIEPVVCHPSEREDKSITLKYGENIILGFSINLLEKDSNKYH